MLYREDDDARGYFIAWKQSDQDKRNIKLNNLVQNKSFRVIDSEKKSLGVSVLAPSKSVKVLLVEDNSHNIQSFVEMMTQCQVTCTIAENAQEAFQFFSDSLKDGVLFDMVFLKLIMPSVSGYECAKELREIELSHKIGCLQRHFICGLASLIDERVQMESKKAGIDHVEVKPLCYEKIKQLIDKHMRKRNK